LVDLMVYYLVEETDAEMAVWMVDVMVDVRVETMVKLMVD